MLLRYRGSEGMLAWAFHRISGVAIWVFILLHVFDILLVGANPTLYDDVLQVYASPIGRVLEGLLGAALLYHALNGLRIIIMDFWPPMTRYHRQLWYACWILFVLVGIPVTLQIMAPAFGFAPPFTFGAAADGARDPVRIGQAPGRRLRARRLVRHAADRPRPVRPGARHYLITALPVRPGRAERGLDRRIRWGSIAGGPSTG